MKYAVLTTALTLGFICSAHAGPNPFLSQPEIDGMVRIPAGSFNFVKDAKTGRVLLVSDNARYLITGEFELRDTWHQNEAIRDPSRLEELSDRMELSMIPFDQMLWLDMNPPGADESKPQLTAFVDPNCPWCHKLFELMAEHPEYHARFVLVPLLGPDSVTKVKQLACAIAKGNRKGALKALVSRDFTTMPNAPDCTPSPALRANVITAQVMGVTGVPFVVNDKGKFKRGYPMELGDFMNERSSDVNVSTRPIEPKAP